jgi:8-oxo-dGTP pyrophosphatase MutT (NUDIX family)
MSTTPPTDATGPLLDPAWHAQCVARASLPAATPRATLWLGEQAIGSLAEPAFSDAVRRQSLDDCLVRQTHADQPLPQWHLQGEPNAALARLARVLRTLDYARVDALWRDELLAVRDAQGRELARVERGATRAVGLRTHAVHLNARTPDGRVWVQQRALSKATDPGLWDTLMGGMVSAHDSLTQALVRETWEEAGLTLRSLHRLTAGGRFVQRQPHAMDGGLGYVVEQVDWFDAVVPAGLAPRNTDGEVSQFLALTPAELATQLMAGQFTLEASLVLAQAVFGLAATLA